jgi:hypothetical protein
MLLLQRNHVMHLLCYEQVSMACVGNICRGQDMSTKQPPRYISRPISCGASLLKELRFFYSNKDIPPTIAVDCSLKKQL